MNKASSAAYYKARYALALNLWDIGAFLTADSKHPFVVERDSPNGKERGFKLKLHETNPDAPLSPFYLNLRTANNKNGPLTQEVVDQAASCMQMMVANEGSEFDAVAGFPRAGDPFAKSLASFMGKSLVKLNKYEHDGKRKVASLELPIPVSIRRVLGVDDLITRADTKREGVGVLRDEGIEVTDIAVVVDREQGGSDGLAALGCRLLAVFTITKLLDFYVAMEKISPQLNSDIQKYLASQV